MKIDIKGLLVLAVIVGFLAFFWLAPSGGLQAAPNVKMQTIDGKTLTLEQLKGKPYMVVFWATDCPGCVKEIPHLNDLYTNLKSQGFTVIAIAMPHDQIPRIQAMREQKNMQYDIVFDKDGSLAKAFGGVMVTPTNFLISPSGNIALQKMGEFNPETMQKTILDMLKG